MRVVAYFFCKHDSAERNDPRRAVTTLAFRFAAQWPAVAAEFERRLADPTARAELEAHVTGGKGSLDDLFRVALADPLTAALSANPPPHPLVIIIDALDELDAGASRSQFLNLVGRNLPSLPDCVRLIVTSRPEEDIVQSLDRLEPLELANSDQRQQDDLRVFINSQIIAQTSLAQWSANDKAAVADFVLGQCDGVFLAAQLAQRAIVLRDNDKAKKALTMGDVKQLVGKGLEFIYQTYRETLDRIHHQLELVAKGDEAVLQGLVQTLTNILAVLVAAREPLRAADIPELAGARCAVSGVVAGRMMNALSLLFSAPSRDAGVEPLHKTVFDFLVSKKEAGKHYADPALGHAILAASSLRCLAESGLLHKPEAPATTLHRYAVRHGHVHLTTAMASLSSTQDAARQGAVHCCRQCVAVGLCAGPGAV
jgi:hypothetical protein